MIQYLYECLIFDVKIQLNEWSKETIRKKKLC